jgi:phosphohistidine phosphatase SixA
MTKIHKSRRLSLHTLTLSVALSLLAACGPGPDTTKPTVSLKASSATVTTISSITLTADAKDNIGVKKVEFYRGNDKIAEDSTAPFETSVSFTAADNGNIQFSAKAYDAAGNVGESVAESVNVNIVLAVRPSEGFVVPTTLTQEFRASQPVTWSVTEASGGSITAAGVYTAPVIAGDYTVRATPATGAAVDIKVKVISTSAATNVSFEKLKTGGYNLFFRHAETGSNGSDQTGSGDSWWKSCDNTKMRQLNDQGKGDARAIGSKLKQQAIPVDRYITSELCRGFETAQLINEALQLPTSQLLQNPVLNCTGGCANAPGQDNAGIEQLLRVAPMIGKNNILVGHATTTAFSNTLGRGDAGVFEPLADGLVRFLGYVRLSDWKKP